MGKYKKPLVVLAAIILIAGLGAGGYTLYKNKKSADKTPAGVQSEKQIAAEVAKVAGFDSVTAAYIAKDYEKTIVLAKEYGANTSNNSIQRLNVYNLCMVAAIQIKQDAVKKDCYEAAKLVVNSLPTEQVKAVWIGTLDDTFNGTQNNIGTDDGSSS